jgi:hypothetical protein
MKRVPSWVEPKIRQATRGRKATPGSSGEKPRRDYGDEHGQQDQCRHE